MPIKDCFGNIAQIGDEISFSVGNSGAKSWEIAVVTKITDKCVCFNGKPGSNWRQNETAELRRKSGCFVINIFKRDPGMIGQSNAWKSLDKHISGISGEAKDIREKVSSDLHRDNCQSAWIHHAYFINALIEKLEEGDNNG